MHFSTNERLKHVHADHNENKSLRFLHEKRKENLLPLPLATGSMKRLVLVS